ncbi:MAG: hypothetical protein MJZ57_07305 [Bacteroidales bacterium]|nr:hypothetical protein [Bacteroidales bacterium]
MKKLAVLAIVCLSLVCSSCYRDSNTYNASITESHFANHDNETSVNAVLKTINSFWDGDYSYKGLSTLEADVKADLRFVSAVTAINLHNTELADYFEEGDYFIYTLTRTTGGDNVILHQYKITKDGSEEILDIVGSDEK